MPCSCPKHSGGASQRIWPLSYSGIGGYSPAYRVGYADPTRRQGNFISLEGALHQEWDQVKSPSRLTWEEARQAARAEWDARAAGKLNQQEKK